MARPKRLQWDQRVQVFLDFRRLRKIYPTAKSHRIARSTVTGIVQEFVELGFSREPRPLLSPPLLEVAQNRHVEEVGAALNQRHDLTVQVPQRNLREGFTEEDALAEGGAGRVRQTRNSIVTETVLWHLKGTAVEATIREVEIAIADYNARCMELWQSIRTGLEGTCGTLVGPNRMEPTAAPVFRIYLFLVDRLYSDLFAPDPRTGSREDWPHFEVNTPSGGVLQVAPLQGDVGAAATGSIENQKAVIRGTRELLGLYHSEYRRRAQELVRLYQDLHYLPEVVLEALKSVFPETIRSTICPDCPYPEINRVKV